MRHRFRPDIFLRKRAARWLVFSLAAMALTACANTAQNTPLAADVIEIPYEMSEFGLMSVEARLNHAQTHRFVIDTGATRSVISADTASQLGLEVDDTKTTMVHGIFESQLRPFTQVAHLQIGAISVQEADLVVLDNPEITGKGVNLLGVDILKDYAFEVDTKAEVIRLHPATTFSAGRFRAWTKIPLETNPYDANDYGLYFAEARIDGKNVPAIIDLGAAFSAMNWESVRSRRLKRLRRSLREQWQLSGANGDFSPLVVARYGNIAMQGHSWNEQKLVVADLHTLDILGSQGQPLMLAGANMFLGQDYVIDFARLTLYVKPSRSKLDPNAVIRLGDSRILPVARIDWPR